MTHQLTPEVLAIDVPEGANRFTVFNDEKPYLSYFTGVETGRLYLYPGKWEIIGRASEVTEQHAANIVKNNQYGHNGWKTYTEPSGLMYWEKNAIESFHSLLRSKGIFLVNPYGEQKPDCLGKGFCCDGIRCKALEWQEAENKKSDPIILKIVK